jgi:hypothetical protein
MFLFIYFLFICMYICDIDNDVICLLLVCGLWYEFEMQSMNHNKSFGYNLVELFSNASTGTSFKHWQQNRKC